MRSTTAPPHAVRLSTATGRSVRSTVGFAATAMLVSYLPFSATNGVLGSIGATSAVASGALLARRAA